jgi:mono/diheme cytochrome c family protein
MNRILKTILIVFGALAALLVVLVIILNLVGSSRLKNSPEVAVQTVPVPTDAEALARGEHLVHSVSGCAGCHGENLGGAVFIDEQPIGYVAAPNLTAGNGCVGATYTPEDWTRAIRHGVGGDGRTLVFMPSQQLAALSDSDLGAVIAYLQTVPPVDNDLGEPAFGFVGTLIFGVMGYGAMPVNVIDHESVGGSGPAQGVTAEYGQYLVTIAVCRDCHGTDLAGQTDPNAPQGPDLTPGGELGSWSEDDFLTLIRTGTTPEGRQVSEEMPWQFYRNMTDEELQAIWLYLQSLPANSE